MILIVAYKSIWQKDLGGDHLQITMNSWCVSTWGEMKKVTRYEEMKSSEDSLMGHQCWCHVRKWMRDKKGLNQWYNHYLLNTEDHLEGDKNRDVCILRSWISKNFKAKEISQGKIWKDWTCIPVRTGRPRGLYMQKGSLISVRRRPAEARAETHGALMTIQRRSWGLGKKTSWDVLHLWLKRLC